MDKVNILYLITEFDVGGAENVLYDIATRIDRQKYNPSAACLTGYGAIGGKLSESGIEVEYLDMRCKADLRIIPRLVKLLRKRKTHILHSHLFHANILGRIAGKIAGVPIIISTVHITELRRRHHLWLDRFTSGLVNTEICICEAVKEFTIREAKIPSEKLVSIPNGINLEKFDRQWDREGKRAELGIGSQTKVIGTVSRLSKQKGLEFLLRAVPGILRNVPDSVFIIVGDGELKPELRQLAEKLGIEKKIIFAGFRKDVLEVMNIFDVFVLSSLWEGMPLALLEAMALSKPIVATAVGGCRELVIDGENGFLVKPSEVSELSEAITTILRDSELASRMERNSRKKAEQYTVEKMVEKTEKLYDGLLHTLTCKEVLTG